MKFVARFSHLEKTYCQVGDIIRTGSPIGKMGGTPKWAPHLDLTCWQVTGSDRSVFTRVYGDYEKQKDSYSKEQAEYFIDDDLFGVTPVITTTWLDPTYPHEWEHPAIDLVPIDRHDTQKHFTIHWNRSWVGQVVLIGYDSVGYGFFVQIEYNTN